MGSIFDKYGILHGLPKIGQKITYSKPSRFSWLPNVIEDEKRLLELGKNYTVDSCELNSSSTYVWLQEFPKDTDHMPFFNMSAFTWELPVLNPVDLVGFTSLDMSTVKRTYGYGFKDLSGNILIKGDIYIVIDCDKSGRIESAEWENKI